MIPGLEVALAFAVSLVACGVCRRAGLRWGLLDVPNPRSSHSAPTPRGGGAGLLLGLAAGVWAATWSIPWLTVWPTVWPEGYAWFPWLAGLLMLAGLVDDHRGLPAAPRLALYLAACAAAAWALLWPVSPWLLAVAAVYLLWLLNLCNFMDGIDGIAAAETIFACTAAALLALLNGGDTHFILFCLLLSAACLGFLCWNWAPARLFLGDAGSIPLGFTLGVLSLAGVLPVYCWLILLAVFVGDASLTLAWRARTGRRLSQAHRDHAYQHLARRWNSHGRVVWAVTAYNLLWLAPLAGLAMYRQDWAAPALAAAYLPLLPAWIKAVKLS